MAEYNGRDYFLKVQVGATSTSKVRDYDVDQLLQQKGALLSSNGTSNNLANFAVIEPGAQSTVLSMNASGMPAWVSLSSIATDAGDGPLNISLNGNVSKLFSADQPDAQASTLTFAIGSSNGNISVNGSDIPVKGLEDTAFTSITDLADELNGATYNFAKKSDIKDGGLKLDVNGSTSNFWSANSASTVTLSFAEGSTNGAIKVGSTNVMVHGLGSAAFADTTTFATPGYVDGATTSVYNNVYNAATTYVNDKIDNLGHIMTVVETGATPTSYTNPVQGDVYIVNTGEDAGKEYVWTADSAWELLGQNNIDLSEYTKTADLGDLALKDSVSVPANSFVTGLTSGTTNQTINPSASASIVGWQDGQVTYITPYFEVNNGILSLIASTTNVAYQAPSYTSISVSVDPITVTHNTYDVVKNANPVSCTIS